MRCAPRSAKYPATHEHLLKTYELVKAGQARLIDLVVGFIDPNAPDVIAQPQNPTKIELEADAEDKDDDAEDGDEAEEEAIDTGPDPEEVARRMGSIAEAAPAGAGLDRQARRRRSQDPEAAQEAGGRVHGAQALAAHVRCADRSAAHAHQRDPADREGDHDHRGARLPACRARISSPPSRRTRPARAGSPST